MKRKNKNFVTLEAVHTHTHTHTGSFRGYLEWNKKGKENIKTHVLYVVLSLGKLQKASLLNQKCT